MPLFRQSLSRNAITKFYQIWYIYIAKHFVFMLIIFQVDRQSVSIRFLCLKKNPITFEQECTVLLFIRHTQVCQYWMNTILHDTKLICMTEDFY